jgi:hypothetical protein
MKKIIPSILLSAVSSLFLTLGMVRAAEKCDPLFQHPSVNLVDSSVSAPNCSLPCTLI